MVYLDYASTCLVVKYPQQRYRDVLGGAGFFNPNANYAHKEKILLKKMEDRVKKAIGAKGGKVVFGGTSSQLIENLMYSIERNPFYSCYCIGSCFEHDSCDRFLTNKCDTINEFETFLRDHRGFRMVAMWMGVNNLTGEIFPIEEIGGLCHKYLDAFYICDMTAMIGHAPIPANIDNWCDCAMWSGHKLGTELGIGAMWISDRLDKWLDGFTLHGTPNLAGACAMTDAVEDACDKVYLKDRNWMTLFNNLYCLLKQNDIDVKPIADMPPSTCAINAIRLPGIDARALQTYLASKDVYIGLGQSSCAEAEDNRVLCSGYGLSAKEASEVIRISFGENTIIEDIQSLVKNIREFKEKFL